MMGERLGKWVLSTEIGRGGMGCVYLAQEDLTGRQAAVKVLSVELAADPGFLGRFEREIEALGKLSHPHVVQFYDAGHDAGRYFYAMEYVPGESLDEIVQRRKRLGWRNVLDIALQICPALKHVHDHGIIHRDIKLSNVLVRDDGIVKLTDFGIAKVFAASDLTQTGGVIGTAEYLSPEQAMGKPVTKKSDIYSLGIVFYCLLTGRLPFEGTSFVELLHKHRYAQFDRPAKIATDVPHDIDEIVCQMLDKDPAKRPPDCLVLAKQLDSIRRKLERRDQGTWLADNDTVVQTKSTFDPKTPERGTPPERDSAAPEPRTLLARLSNNPFVVALLLAAVLGVIVAPFLRRPNPADLFARGAELMKSERLADMESAWNDCFEPILREYPETPFKEAIEEYRRQLDVARHPETSEAKRFVDVGDKRLQAGDLAGATAIWKNVVAAFDGIPSERYAVELARRRLAADHSARAETEPLDRIRPMLARAAELRAQGKIEDADRIVAALEALYRNDPGGAAALDLIRAARK